MDLSFGANRWARQENAPQAEARLTAAACAMVYCYAEYPTGTAAYQELLRLAAIGASDALASERTQLPNQSGLFGYSADSCMKSLEQQGLVCIDDFFILEGYFPDWCRVEVFGSDGA